MIPREKLLVNMDIRKALLGVFFSFSNGLQTAGDSFYEEITCKQFFLLICLSLFEDKPPTINELAEVMKSTHQNVKQIVNKLEKNGFLKVVSDEQDKRKLRVVQTRKVEVLQSKYQEAERGFFEMFYAGISEAELQAVYQTVTKMEQNLDTIRRDWDE